MILCRMSLDFKIFRIFFSIIMPNFSAIHYFLPIISLRFSIRKVTNRMPKRYLLQKKRLTMNAEW